MRSVASAVLAAVAAALLLPLLFIATESAMQWAPIVADDFRFAYMLAGPFALVTALAVAWPSYGLQSRRASPVRRLLVAAMTCAVVPVALFLLLGDEFPWKAGVAGAATLLLWLGARRLANQYVSIDRSIRSEPRG